MHCCQELSLQNETAVTNLKNEIESDVEMAYIEHQSKEMTILKHRRNSNEPTNAIYQRNRFNVYTMVLIKWHETIVLFRVKFVLRNVPVILFTVLEKFLVIVKEAVPVCVPTQGHSARFAAVIRSQDTARYGRPHAVDGTVFAGKAFPAKTFVWMNFLKGTVFLTLDDNKRMVVYLSYLRLRWIIVNIGEEIVITCKYSRCGFYDSFYQRKMRH